MSRLEADEIVHTALRAAIAKLESDGLSGPEIRERKHFDPAARLAFSVLTGSTVRSVKLTTPHLPGLGSVDIGIRKPPLLIELKWSYDERRSKIFESVWDAIKLVLLAAEYRCIGYIATGASMRAWRTCESRELFTGPVVDPRDLWALPLMPRGPNGGRTVGADLVRGSPSQSKPLTAPVGITIAPLPPIAVSGGYELRRPGSPPTGRWAAGKRAAVESAGLRAFRRSQR